VHRDRTHLLEAARLLIQAILVAAPWVLEPSPKARACSALAGSKVLPNSSWQSAS
jgi:hypothetical protein